MSTESDDGADEGSEPVRVWLVERTYGDDELNIVILVYADESGAHYFRKERALTSFDDERETPVSLVVPADELGTTDEVERERYAAEAARMAAEHDPDEHV